MSPCELALSGAALIIELSSETESGVCPESLPVPLLTVRTRLQVLIAVQFSLAAIRLSPPRLSAPQVLAYVKFRSPVPQFPAIRNEVGSRSIITSFTMSRTYIHRKHPLSYRALVPLLEKRVVGILGTATLLPLRASPARLCVLKSSSGEGVGRPG